MATVAALESSSSLILFQGRTVDHTPRAIDGAQRLAQVLAERLGTAFTSVGTPRAPLNGSGQEQLKRALPELRQLAEVLERHLEDRHTPITVLPLCAGAMATLPVIARHHPDACLLWLDAHGDLNTPESSESGYPGGMVIAAAAGLWQSSLGSGWTLDQLVLADGRELDHAEEQLIERSGITHLKSEALIPEALSKAIGDRPVYVHLDCDIASPGLLPTHYSVEGGPNLDELKALFHAISQHDVIGLEIAEFEEQPDFAMKAAAEALCDVLSPLYKNLRFA